MAHPAVVERLEAMREDPADADGILHGWLRRFAAIPDRGLRRRILGRLLDEVDDGSLLGTLHRLDERARGGDGPARAFEAELALTPSVLAELPYDRMRDLYAAARAAGEEALSRRFLGWAAAEGGPAPHNPHLDLSAGERTAAARGRDRMLLDRLLHDRDPRVIAALLDNARITERDVVRIAAMRPTLPAILERIAAHPRWGIRYRVRKAICANPAAPMGLARPILPTLLRQDLVQLAGSHVLSEELHEEVSSLLGRR